MADTHPLENVMKKAAEDSEGEKVSVRDLLELYSHRSFGPIFILLGLVVVLPPLGAVPGLPAVVGVVILLFSLQMVFGRNHIWLPDFVESMSIEKDKIETAHEKSKGALSFIDKMVTERIEWAAGNYAKYAAAILVSFMALLLIPLELVPFAVALPGVAIVMVGVALLARDGLLMLIAYALSAIALVILILGSPIKNWIGLG